MIKNLSLRLRLTLMTTLIIIVVTIITTSLSVNNAFASFVNPIQSISLHSVNGKDELNKDVFYEDEIKSEVTQSIESIQGAMAISTVVSTAQVNFRYNAMLVMIIVIIIGGSFTYFIIGKLLNPVKSLSNQIKDINENQLSNRIVGFNTKDELSKLSDSLNIMLDRIDKAFESQKRFSADAAHELKTPLAVLKTNIDVLSMDENPTIEDYAYTVDVFKSQVDRMVNLVDNLFLIAAKREYDFNDNINIDFVFTEILKDLKEEIDKKNINVSLNKGNINIVGNNIMITHALSNVIQNAIKYNKDKGEIYIDSFEENGDAIINIKDTGIGIPEEKIEYIFEPFYRVDSSRSRKIGGTGLGLAITSNIIKNHSGTIKYIKNKDEGSTFQIKFKINYLKDI
ncbi:HAMP domain-containing sensor histidine kinase [Clostridium sp.]|uniref:HAMP domain-containing sensor histidine kinase n=1 Tax=Clostridium sp. TaxID=1506 RepID=UPI003F2CFF48